MKSDNKISRFSSAWFPIAAFLLYLFIIPVSQNEIKIVLFTFIISYSAFILPWINGKIIFCDARILQPVMIIIFTMGFFSLYGFINHNIGARHTSVIYLLVPISYLLIFFSCYDVDFYKILPRVFFFGVSCIFIIFMSFVLCNNGIIPFPLYINVGIDEQELVGHGDVTRMRFYPIASLIFLVPFFISRLIILIFQYGSMNRSMLNPLLASIFGIIMAIVSGRRALLLSIVIAPFLTVIAIRYFLSQRILSSRTIITLIILCAIGISTYQFVSVSIDQWSFDGFMRTVMAGFDFEQGNAETEARRSQFYSLIDLWLQAPFWGHGLGCNASDVIRSDRGYEYELQYMLLLASIGLIGMILCVFAFILGMRTVFVLIDHKQDAFLLLVPYVVSSLCFILSNATNPYFQAPGQQWEVFVTLGCINALALYERNKYDQIQLVEY